MNSFKNNIDSLIAALTGFVLILLYTRHGGIGISPDSIVYTSTARSIQEGKGLIQFDGTPMILFPAAYPLFLSGIMAIMHVDVLQFAPYLNAILFGIVIYTSGCMMHKFKYHTNWYKWILLACIICSPALLEIYFMLWSESLFVVWIMLFFLSIQYYFRTRSTFAFVLFTLIASIAVVTRYAGVTVIGTGCLLLLFDKALQWKKRLFNTATFGIFSIVLLVLNIVRNNLVSGLVTGNRQKGIIPLHTNIEYLGSVLSDWLPLGSVSKTIALIIGTIVLLLFIFIFIYRVVKNIHYYSYENIATAFFIVYALFMVISATISRYEPINSRLLSPLFISFIVGISYKVPEWINATNHKVFKWMLSAGTILIVIAFLYKQINVDRNNYKDIDEGGIGGYTEDSWRESPTISFLKNNPSLFKNDSLVVSNAGHAVYFYTGHQIKNIPERVHYEEVKNFYTKPYYYLIWFNNEGNVDLLNIDEIAAKKKMQRLQSFDDGAIFLCTNK